VPFVLAVDVKEIKDQEIKNINRKEIIEFYKNGIVNHYKKYYRSKYNDSIKQTFVDGYCSKEENNNHASLGLEYNAKL
jgi:hypothetical protein